MQIGAAIGAQTGARVTLLHVTDYYPGMHAGMSQIDETLSELLQTDTPIAQHLIKSARLFRYKAIDAQIELRHGLPEEGILSATDTGNYDLLVIGKSAQGILNRIFRPEISHTLVDRVLCPILVIREPLQLLAAN